MNIRPLVFATFLMILSLAFYACTSVEEMVMEETVREREEEQKTPQPRPAVIVKSSQVVVYNGKPQPISFSYAGEQDLNIVYYPSREARTENREGSPAAPVQAGTYFVRIRNSYEELLAEYRILKRPVTIEAAENQYAYYNGDPKRIKAGAEPSVPLSYSYYPNRELREAAQNAVKEPVSGGNSGRRLLTQSYTGYRRVERAPIEPGTYYVWIYFPGDKNHEAAQKNVQFTILTR